MGGGWRSEMAVRTTRLDAEIERDVKDALYADLRVISEGIDVQVREGKVYLRGTVPDETQKALARMIADRIKGVREVINLLDILPLATRTDTDITADVVSALTLDTMVDEDKIDVTTVDGIVYLRGTVNSYAERKAADDDARAVRGVVDVINELVVAPSYARSDGEIKADLLRQLHDNIRIDPTAVDVQVRHGVVYLRGNVANMEQRWLVDELARWTPGVIDVVNDLGIVTLQGP